MTTDTPSDELVRQLRTMNIGLSHEAADRIEELEKMLATESEVTLNFSEAINRLESYNAELKRIVTTVAAARQVN